MGQFKPMVKMYTTEPTVELKLKKGGHVKMPKKAAKKMDGGVMGALASQPAVRVPAVAPTGRAPAKPSMAERRRAMMGRRGMAAPVMAKKGGEMESKAEHAKEMKEMGKVEAELKAHEKKPASKAHAGLKTGGVVKGQGGYKKGGAVKCKATGGVVNGQGGYKKGGAVKKFAKGGQVQDDGRPEQMPQGKKPPSAPVSISRLSGTFKKGGVVKKAQGGQMPVTRSAAVERREAAVSTPTAEEMKKLEEAYDRPLRMEQKGAENFQRNIRLRRKGGCV